MAVLRHVLTSQLIKADVVVPRRRISEARLVSAKQLQLSIYESEAMDYPIQVINTVTRIDELLTRGGFESCKNYDDATSSSFVHCRHKIRIATYKYCRIENATERTNYQIHCE